MCKEVFLPILTICYCLINLPSYTFNLLESRCTVIAAKDLKLKVLEHNAIKFSGQYTAGYDKMMLSDPRYQRFVSWLYLVNFLSRHVVFLSSMSPCQQVKLSSCQARFQFYQFVNFINCHLVNLTEKTLYILCLGVAMAMGLKTIQSYLIALALPPGLQFAKPNSLSEWNSMIPRISIKSTKQSAHQMRKRAIWIILKMTSGFPTPAKMGFRICPFSEKDPSP